MFVSQVWGCHYPPFTVRNTFCHPATILRFTKHVFLTFQSFVMANLRTSVPFHEKSGQGRVFFECCLPYLLLPWSGEVVASDVLPERSRKRHVSFRKPRNMTRVVVIKRNRSGGFFWQVWGFTGGKYCFYHKGPIHRFWKACLLAVLELYKDTPGTQWTIPWEKEMSGESVLWVLTPIRVVPLITWNCAVNFTFKPGVGSILFISKSWLQFLL